MSVEPSKEVQAQMIGMINAGAMSHEICEALGVKGRAIHNCMQAMKAGGHPRFRQVGIPDPTFFRGMGRKKEAMPTPAAEAA